MDSRTFARKRENGRMTLGKLYSACGIKVSQASGKNLEDSVPLVAEWFAIDENREHFVTKKKGAPRIYIFSTCVHLIEEIEHYVFEYHKGRAKNPSEKPRQKNDHLMDALRYLIQIPPRYVEGFGLQLEGVDDDVEETRKSRRRRVAVCPYTGRKYN
jgi:hypothetical protein